MKTKNMAFFAILSAVLFSSIVSATTPGLPNQLFGTVSINGAPATDGTIVSARINSEEVKYIPTINGKYGYSSSVFLIDDLDHNREGSVINLFVNGVDTGVSTYFANGKSTELNLAITVEVPVQQRSSGGGSYTPVNNTNTTNTTNATVAVYAPTGLCVERWTCDSWSECKDGAQKRTCSDVNKCGTVDDLPMIIQPCSLDEAASDSLGASETQIQSGGLLGITGRMFSFASSNAAYLIVLIIIAGLIAYYFNSKKSAYAIKPVKRRL